ncbi:MAG TPA: sialidase family protein [Candidatus Dormibacteraeota bacterium]|jgi:hypothetical protein|nr:sialidase family protein [Candidatus Dormibacteraeota bacterium]
MRRLVLPLAAAVLLVLAMFPATSRAATPASGTLSPGSPSLTWTNTLPMNGTAPAVTRISCNVPTTCDDFSLTIDRGTNTNAYVTLTLTPSGAVAAEEIILYAPGCAVDPTVTCYQVLGTEVHMTGPANGVYNVRVACTHCLSAGYSLTATMASNAPAPNIPGPFDQSFGWVSHLMPGIDDKGTPPTAAGEPGIWINKLGHVIVNTFGPTIWTSQDSGRSFSLANQSVDVGCQSGDADAVVSFDDAYYADNLCLAGGTNLSYTSRDGGKTWGAAGGLPAIGGLPDSDRQWYAPDPVTPGRVYFAYHDLQGPNINVWRSDDYGQTFTVFAPVTLLGPTFVDASQGNTTSRPWVDPVDPKIVSIVYAYNDAATSATTPPNAPEFNLREFGLARSTDAGATWTNTRIYDAGTTAGQTNTVAHEFPQATMDSAGNMYILFSEKIGAQSNTHIMMGVLPRNATTFSKVVQVDKGGLLSNVFPWAIGGDPGMVDITWYGSPAADNNDHAAQWSEMFTQSTNALSANPTFVQSRISGPQSMHNADICLAGTLCLVTGGNRNLADFQGVAIDPCGYAQAVWDDDSTGTGTTMFARQTSGSSIHPTACAATTSGGNGSGTPTTPTTGGSGSAPTGLVNTSAPEARAALPAAAVLALVAAAALAGRRRRRRS